VDLIIEGHHWYHWGHCFEATNRQLKKILFIAHGWRPRTSINTTTPRCIAFLVSIPDFERKSLCVTIDASLMLPLLSSSSLLDTRNQAWQP
jgi:hypothetical protein